MRLSYIGLIVLLAMVAMSSIVTALDVRVSAVGPDTVVVKWDESSVANFGYYQIWREEVDKSEPKIVDTWADRGKTSYTDDDVHAGTKYNFTVKAFDDQDHFIDQGSVSVTPCLERNWMMFVGGILMIVLLVVMLRFLMGLPPQVLVPIVLLFIGIAGALMWLSNIASDVSACP